MKKLLSIALALVMVLSLTVAVAAEEVIWSEDILFFSASGWSQYTLEVTVADFDAALQTPGAYVVITRSAPTDVTGYVDGAYEKFCVTDSWWAGRIANDAGEEINTMRLGTGGHTIAAATEAGSPYDVTLDCVLDDGTKVWYDAAEFYAQWNDSGFNAGGSEVLLISNTSSTAYDIVNISVVVPDAPIGAPEEEAPVEDEAPAVEDTPAVEDAPVVDAPAADEAPAETGLALAVVPMIVALAAAVISKRR